MIKHMADMTRFDLDKVNVIGKLGTTPQERGLTTQQFKDKFDEGPIALGEFVNETLIPEVEAHLADSVKHITAEERTKWNAIDNLAGWKIYNDITELGLTVGSETMESICLAMPDKSELRFLKRTSNPSSAYPDNAGVLLVRRYAVYRIELRFMNGFLGNVNEWIGYFDSNTTPNFSGWKKISRILSGAGSPEGVITANVGDLYCRTDVGELYVKQTGTGNTGWKAVQTA